jgi:hypothetical protein
MQAGLKILLLLAKWSVVGVMSLGVGTGRASDDDRSRAQPEKQKSEAEAVHKAVVRALPLLIKASAHEYPKHRECFSCHNQAVPAVALRLAQSRGFDIGDQTLRLIAEHTESDLNGAIEDYRRGQGQPGGVIRAGYALWALEAGGWTPDETTASVAHYLDVVQSDRNRWPPRANRPPSESSAFTATALALRGLKAFGPAIKSEASGTAPTGTKAQPNSDKATAQRERALRWLEETKPLETEDRVFRLWGLKTAGGSGESITSAAKDLLQTQRPDGGWSQLDTPVVPAKAKTKDGKNDPAFASDAYATGSALVALHMAGGISTDHPDYRRGLDFLLRTQRTDGTWFIKSRSRPFQTYFESGFPHGPDQFISAAGSAWATAALVLACPAP